MVTSTNSKTTQVSRIRWRAFSNSTEPIVITLGTAHGFASRPNMALDEVKDAHRKALDQTVEWFQKTLVI